MTDQPSERPAGRTWVSVLIVLAWIAWLVSPFFYFSGLFATASFFGGTEPSAADERAQDTAFLVAGLLGLGGPVIGLVAAAVDRRRVAACFLGGAIVLSLVPLAVLAIDAAQHAPPPERDDGPVQCQERSGTGNDCPGG
ncbi:hypothetical protein [Aeromicrobium alkaliterrae]|uniref:Major facilitator superfamily (MFS) profile domain-containing protein n=1 Tax=Aeromicrobium alkaliterrae TaxID=302168 RepID=A0ABN2JFF4_9ACTN